MMRYQVLPLVSLNGKFSVKDEVLAEIWNQMVAEGKAQKVFYNGYITTVYDFINFIKNSGNLSILIADNETQKLCYIAWISDYGDGHACIHHCSLGQFKRGAMKKILQYYGEFKNPETGEWIFDTLIGISPENNKLGLKVAKLMGFKMLTPAIPNLCNDVYAGEKVPGVMSFYQYQREAKGE